MPKSPSGPPRRTKARAGEPGKNAPRLEAQILSPDARGDTSTEVPPARMVIDMPARPRKAVRQREYKPPSAPRFRIFIIDSGWNSVARRVLRHNFALIRRLYKEDLLYLLSRKKSVEFIRRHRSLIGRDPIIALHGFHLHLGILRTPRQALMALQTFAQFVGTHRHSGNLEAEIRQRPSPRG